MHGARAGRTTVWMIEASVYNKCVRCGLCLPACPTYLETMTETSGPRGRISLIKAVDEGREDALAPGFVHQMYECLDCRACAAACPSGVEYGRLVEGARERIESQRAPHRSAAHRFARWLGLRVVFGNMAVLRLLAILLRFYQRSGLQRAVRRSGLLRRFGLEQAEALAPAMNATFFSARGQRFEAQERIGTVVLHAGCVMQVAFAGVNRASVRVMQRNGYEVCVASGQGCCGAIAVHAGDAEFGRTLAKRNIAAFERSGAAYYVVNAAGCGSALKEYGHWLAGDSQWRERAERFSARVRDIFELLDERGLRPGLGELNAVVSYQDACHLAHAQRITGAPRRLLSQIPGLRLREMHESAVCCGSAGIYNLTQPEMSARLRKRKVAHAMETGAAIVATSNPGCAMQIEAGLRAAGSEMRVKHAIELLDESYAAPAPA